MRKVRIAGGLPAVWGGYLHVMASVSCGCNWGTVVTILESSEGIAEYIGSRSGSGWFEWKKLRDCGWMWVDGGMDVVGIGPQTDKLRLR
jgi:hypothetical protein